MSNQSPRRRNSWPFSSSRPRPLGGLAAAALLLLSLAAAAVAEGPPPGGTRGPLEIAFSRDGRLAYVAESDENDVAVIDAARGAVVGHLGTGGTQPGALALLPDDRTLLVVNRFSGSLGMIDLSAQHLMARLLLRGGPSDVVVSPDGERAYVSLSQLDQVVALDLATRRERGRIAVGRRPQALALTQNGRRLVCANAGSGDLSVINTDFLTEERRLRSRGVNLRGLALVPAADLGLPTEGTLAVVSCQVPNPQRQATRVEDGGVWSNFVEAIPLEPPATPESIGGMAPPRRFGNSDVVGESWLDPAVPVSRFLAAGAGAPLQLLTVPPGISPPGGGPVPHRRPLSQVEAAADPYQVVLIPNQDSGFVANGGIRAVSRFSLAQMLATDNGWPGLGGFDRDGASLGFRFSAAGGRWSAAGEGPVGIWGGGNRRSPLAPVVVRQQVGLNPRCLALTPDRRQLWVANHLGNSLSVLNAETLELERTISLEAPSRSEAGFAGRVLFNEAFATREQWFSCASCHPDGLSDGRSWQFAHVADDFREVRNTRSLLGGIQRTAPFRWSGHDEELEKFAQEEVTGLLKGQPRPAAELKSLAEFLAGLELPPNPHRNGDGSLTAPAQAGRDLFLGKAGCVRCHAGPMAGGTGRQGWVGTTPEERSLDVPHLAGAWASAPYLHDGRAATLEAIFRQHNGQGRHGRADQLNDGELQQVLAYVREL